MQKCIHDFLQYAKSRSVCILRLFGFLITDTSKTTKHRVPFRWRMQPLSACCCNFQKNTLPWFFTSLSASVGALKDCRQNKPDNDTANYPRPVYLRFFSVDASDSFIHGNFLLFEIMALRGHAEVVADSKRNDDTATKPFSNFARMHDESHVGLPPWLWQKQHRDER